ncbi:conserved hypothetical protein [Desulforamulus reducens MI-1]|uniref:Prophage minor tail protein Z (GPZ) n=1 Tax=Desulforamulus reducens (strain ATCC BAA-1160 / DSM 100696 / MI-1) TaxID=349161 RepID=A4J3U0_DESRM|nr:phage tail protein [Desulforamulus reducens]ABO49743.1 conserved hypothetical protein [Desulforamulus reducens MI-1]
MIELRADQIERVQDLLQHIPEAIPKAISNTINRAAETAKTEAARKARETYYVKHSDVIKTIRITKASPSNLSATVLSRSSPIALSKFNVTPRQPQPKRRKPIIARVKKGAGGSIQGAFVARVTSGHVGVFNRVGPARLPITQRFGPSIPQMIGSETVTRWVEEKALETIDKRLDHEISRVLEGTR